MVHFSHNSKDHELIRKAKNKKGIDIIQ
jgi:hypothetical protein